MKSLLKQCWDRPTLTGAILLLIIAVTQILGAMLNLSGNKSAAIVMVTDLLCLIGALVLLTKGMINRSSVWIKIVSIILLIGGIWFLTIVLQGPS